MCPRERNTRGIRHTLSATSCSLPRRLPGCGRIGSFRTAAGRLGFAQLCFYQTGQLALHFAEVEFAIVPRPISSSQRLDISLSILPNPLGKGLLPAKQRSNPAAQQEIADCPGRPAVSFHERMNPVHPPETVGRQLRRCHKIPVLLDSCDKPVNLVIHFPEVRRIVIPHIDGLLPEPPAKLRNVRHSHEVQGSQQVLVKRDRALFEAKLDTVGRQLVLAVQVLRLHPVKECRVIVLKHKHADVATKRTVSASSDQRPLPLTPS